MWNYGNKNQNSGTCYQKERVLNKKTKNKKQKERVLTGKEYDKIFYSDRNVLYLWSG